MEQRRGPRIFSSFWITVEGVDQEPQRRRGNLSKSGIYFEADRPVGRVGSVQWVSIAAGDRALEVEVMGRVVRAVILDDARSGAVTGVALELMPENLDKRVALEALVSYVESCQLDEEIAVDFFEESVAQQALGELAAGSAAGPHRVTLTARWQPAPGELVTFELEPAAGGPPRRVRGKVVAVDPDRGQLYRIAVSLGEAAQGVQEEQPAPRQGRRVGGGSVVDAIDTLFADLLVVGVDDAPPPPREHLAGELSRIRLPSLLALLEMERMSGTVELTRGDQRAKVFVDEGQVVDAEDDARRAPREVMAVVIGWAAGRFEYRMGAVARENRIGTSTTGLLLDLARQQDEAAQPR